MAYRAVLVVPAQKRIEFIGIESEESFLADAKRLIGVNEITCYRLFNEEFVWVDDEGLLRRNWAECSFWKFKLRPENTIAGNGIIIGTDAEGGTRSTAFTDLRQVAPFIEWVDPRNVRVRAPTITFYDQSGKGGDEITQLVNPTEPAEWTFNNQPRR